MVVTDSAAWWLEACTRTWILRQSLVTFEMIEQFTADRHIVAVWESIEDRRAAIDAAWTQACVNVTRRVDAGVAYRWWIHPDCAEIDCRHPLRQLVSLHVVRYAKRYTFVPGARDDEMENAIWA